MADQAFAERREHQRYPLSTSIQFYHGPSEGGYSARCVDLSAGGMKMYVPPNVPARPGQPIQVTIGSFDRPEFAGLSNRPVNGTIVRVDRGNLLDKGHLAVGVRFAPLPA